ncbi:unnamed protein product [Onchocerca flexuosa]|uniref:SWIM-type domain-containing protein n=1 Tax=Onchocerca flexuosa TaxID=387005 RepID=A0A183H6U8_9BILA|nr:unnamed protein product [Onchocerca flexuosa]
MLRRRLNLGHRTRAAEGMRSLTANQTEEELDQQTSEDKEWLKCEQYDVQSDMRMHDCKHVHRLLSFRSASFSTE